MNGFALLRLLYAGCLLLASVVGWRFGGRSERAGVAIMIVASLATVIVQEPRVLDPDTVFAGLVAVDVGALLAFVVLALRSRRFWPLWAAAFQLIAVSGHGVVLLGPDRIVQAYMLFQGFWAYPILVAIVVGAMSHARSARGRGSA